MNNIKLFLLLGCLTGIFVLIGSQFGGSGGAIIALGFAAVMNLGAYFFSDRIVLAMYRAKEVNEVDEPRLYGTVRLLVQQARMPMPKVYIIEEDAPNAFATGRSPKHAAIAATTGLVRLVSDEELKGVMAHELAHVANRDILIGTIAATAAGAITMIATMIRWGALFGGIGSNRDDENNSGSGGIVAAIAISIIAPIAAMLIQMAISRSREYLADQRGARLAGNSMGLANALRKLELSAGKYEALSSPATAHMFIVNPLSAKGITRLFSTHPPTAERIARLEAMSKLTNLEVSK
ncbi:MAG: zinc metalloprotease HtpX [bacterium]